MRLLRWLNAGTVEHRNAPFTRDYRGTAEILAAINGVALNLPRRLLLRKFGCGRPRSSRIITLIPSRLVSFFGGGEAFSICIVSEAETDTPRGGLMSRFSERMHSYYCITLRRSFEESMCHSEISTYKNECRILHSTVCIVGESEAPSSSSWVYFLVYVIRIA